MNLYVTSILITARFFVAAKKMLSIFINGINGALDMIPWWLMILLVFFATKKLMNSYRNGVIYGGLLFMIGACGYWHMMNETLAIVITAVIFSLLIGLPIGIALAAVRGADTIVRPILDAMQTMPTFVYMIPAVMLLGPGKVPAVLATVVYAVVPVIRLTSHGIRQVDQEVVEASRSFGSSSWQTLFKVADTSGAADDHDRYQPDDDDGGGDGSYLCHDRCERTWYGSFDRY